MPNPKEAANKKALFAKVKGKLAKNFDRAKVKEPTKRGQQLPGGIVNGHATLSSWDLRKTEKGTPILSLTGIVTIPEEYEGARAQVQHWLQESEYSTWEQITDNICSDCGFLFQAIPEETIEELDIHALSEDFDLDDLPDFLDKLCKAKPQFLYNTRKSRNSDFVNVTIQGPVTDEDEPEEEETEEEEVEEEETEEEVEEEEAEEEEETVIEPEKGDVCKFKTSPKKTEAVEVLKVYPKGKLVDIKITASKKILKGVAWDKLIYETEEE